MGFGRDGNNNQTKGNNMSMSKEPLDERPLCPDPVKRASRVAIWVLDAAVVLLICCEDHARRVWRDRADEANLRAARSALEIVALRQLVEKSGAR